MFDIIDYIRFAVSLFAVLTPFGAIPVFLSLTEWQSGEEKAATARQAITTVFVVLCIAGLFGEWLLRLLGTSFASFQVGGGIVLLLMALSMLGAKISAVQQTKEEKAEAHAKESIGVVPLGLPLMAGPGSISSVIIEMQRVSSWEHSALVLACVGLVCLVLWGALKLATPIGRTLGPIGLNIMNRLFGLILAAIAIEVIANGLRALFPFLEGA